MKLKIRDKIIAMMLLIILIPIASLGISSYLASSKMVKQQYTDMGTVIGNQAKTLVESKIKETNKVLQNLSSYDSLKNIEEEENQKKVLDAFISTKESHEFTDVFFATPEGDMYVASGVGIDEPQNRPWYIKAIENEGVVWSELYQDGNTGAYMVTVSEAIYDGGVLKGVIAIDIDLAVFGEAVNEVDIMGGYPIVMDKDGILLVDKRGDTGKKFQGKDSFKEDRENIQLQEYTYRDEASGFVQEQLIVFAPVDGSEWYIATIIGMDGMSQINSIMIKNILIVGLFTIVIGVVIAIVFGKHIANSINKVLMAIRKMEEGDFTTRINTKGNDEFGEVRESFNKMMETLSDFIGNIKTSASSVDDYSGNLAAISEEVSASSLEISKTAEEIAKGASNQADDTENGVSLISKLSDKLVELEGTSGEMVELAEEIRSTSKDSSKVVEDLKEKTELNNESSKRVEEEIMELDRKISEVTEILSTIDAISEQTNLLALNASIEAARAGEYGKGFAVVAEEIRKLAGESKESSNNIKTIVDAVQLESKITVEVVGEVNSRNEEQTEAVERVNNSFETINHLIEQITSKISDIDGQATEMNSDRDEIVRSIENISAISQETAAASEEVTASIEQQTAAIEEVATSAGRLNELSSELNSEISMFKI